MLYCVLYVHSHKQTHILVAWRSGSASVSITKVNLRRPRLVGWVTVSGFSSYVFMFVYLVFNFFVLLMCCIVVTWWGGPAGIEAIIS